MPEDAQNRGRPNDGDEDENVLQRAESAVDRSRNLRQIIVLKRLLRQLARRPPDDPPSASH